MFHASDEAETRTTFWTVFGLVSGVTYLLALAGLSGVATSRYDRRQFVQRVRHWVSRLQIPAYAKREQQEKDMFGA